MQPMIAKNHSTDRIMTPIPIPNSVAVIVLLEISSMEDLFLVSVQWWCTRTSMHACFVTMETARANRDCVRKCACTLIFTLLTNKSLDKLMRVSWSHVYGDVTTF